MIKLNHLIKKDKLYEGLMHTTSMGQTSDMLYKWSGSGEKFEVVEKSYKIQLNFNLPPKEIPLL
jgi:hypothetical protein